MVSDESLEERLTRVEHEVDIIREAVNKNTQGINKLYLTVSALESKVDLMVNEMRNNNNIIMSFFNNYKNTIDKVITNKKEEENMNKQITLKILDVLAKISMITIAGLLGLKAGGLI